jgi:uncharacterized protein
MEYRQMGKNCEKVSFLGFGCMRFPTKDGKIEEVEAEKMIDLALSSGINYFDTAWPYHDKTSEAFVGKVLSKCDRDRYYLADKLPCWLIKSKEDAERLFAMQLENLRTDHVDFYLFHALNAERWSEMLRLGIVELLEGYQASGKIRNLGFSFHDGFPVFEKIIRFRAWDFCQIQYNYIDSNEQAGSRGYELAKSLSIPVVIMEPLKGGSLASLPSDATQEFRRLKPNDSDVRWAFRWLAGQGGIKAILSGMSSLSQLEENLRLFDGITGLDGDEQKAIEAVARTIHSRVKNPCTGCGYCMPCPNGVDIPRNFKQWNSWSMYHNARDLRKDWRSAAFDSARSDKCVSCHLCETKCPQKISIAHDLHLVTEELNAVQL